MKMMNKVMAVMTIVTLTMATPAVAGNKKHNDRRADKVVVAVDNKKAPSHIVSPKAHFDRQPAAPRPEMKVCTFKVSRQAARGNMVARAAKVHGVVDAHFNPRTRTMTVRYDARRTSPRIITRAVA